MRAILLAACLFLTMFVAVAPSSSAYQAPDRCTYWDTGDAICFVRDYDGAICLVTVERGSPYAGVVCASAGWKPYACAVKGTSGDALCLYV